MYFLLLFLENINGNPTASNGKANTTMLTLNPMALMTHAVMVVPI